MKIESALYVNLVGCSFNGNGGSSDSLQGAGIYAKSFMELNLSRVRFTSNRAYKGGEIGRGAKRRADNGSGRLERSGSCIPPNTITNNLMPVASLLSPLFASLITGALYAESLNKFNFNRVYLMGNRADRVGGFFMKSCSDIRGGNNLISGNIEDNDIDDGDFFDNVQWRKTAGWENDNSVRDEYINDQNLYTGFHLESTTFRVNGPFCFSGGYGYISVSSSIFYNGYESPGSDSECNNLWSETEYKPTDYTPPKVSCTASTSVDADGSSELFYCINGGDIGGTAGSCTCTSCNAGYSGNSCQTAGSCTATTNSAKDGTDGTLYCINGGGIGGTTGSCTCINCDGEYGGFGCASDLHPINMDELHRVVSNYQCAACNTGNGLMNIGESVIVEVATYACNEAGTNCAQSENMLSTKDLGGSIACFSDHGGCILDGALSRRIMHIDGRGIMSGTTMTMQLRALTFTRGRALFGGGIEFLNGAAATLSLCLFEECEFTRASKGGGGIFVSDTGATLNLYATKFVGSTGSSENGLDIYNELVSGEIG